MSRSVAVIGAGGHAKVVIATLRAAGFTVQAVFDDNPSRTGFEVLGVPVLGPIDSLVNAGFSVAVIAIGDNAVRQRIAQRLTHMQWLTAVHPNAWVHPSVRLGAGTVVFAGAVIQPEAVVGEHVIINTGATVDHECTVHDFAHIAPGAHLAGRVTVEEGAFVGMGSSVIQTVRIGAWTTLGAGAVVTQDIPAHVTAVGVPARVVKRHPETMEDCHE